MPTRSHWLLLLFWLCEALYVFITETAYWFIELGHFTYGIRKCLNDCSASSPPMCPHFQRSMNEQSNIIMARRNTNNNKSRVLIMISSRATRYLHHQQNKIIMTRETVKCRVAYCRVDACFMLARWMVPSYFSKIWWFSFSLFCHSVHWHHQHWWHLVPWCGYKPSCNVEIEKRDAVTDLPNGGDTNARHLSRKATR